MSAQSLPRVHKPPLCGFELDFLSLTTDGLTHCSSLLQYAENEDKSLPVAQPGVSDRFTHDSYTFSTCSLRVQIGKPHTSNFHSVWDPMATLSGQPEQGFVGGGLSSTHSSPPQAHSHSGTQGSL